MRKVRRRNRVDGDQVELTFNINTQLPFKMDKNNPNPTQATPHSNHNINNLMSHSHTNEDTVGNICQPNFQLNRFIHPFQQSRLVRRQIYNTLYLQDSEKRDFSTQMGNMTEEQKFYQYKRQDLQKLRREKQLQPYGGAQSEPTPKSKQGSSKQYFFKFLKGIYNFYRKITNQPKDPEIAAQTSHIPRQYQTPKPASSKVSTTYVIQKIPAKSLQISSHRIHKSYEIQYYINFIRFDNNQELKTLEGCFDAGQINPYSYHTMQFIVSSILKMCGPVRKFIVERIQILEDDSKVEINMCCLVKPLILPKGTQCTFLSLEDNIAWGLRIWTSNIQITFNNPIDLNKIHLGSQLQIRGYCVKLGINLSKNVSIMFKNPNISKRTSAQFIRFVEQHCEQLCWNFVEYFYDEYLNIGIVAL